MFPSTNLISTISSSSLDLFLLWSFSFYLSSSPLLLNDNGLSACSSPAQVNRISSNRVSSSQRSSLPPSSNWLKWKTFFFVTQDWTKSQRSCLPGTQKDQWATTTNVECSLTAITSLLSRLKTHIQQQQQQQQQQPYNTTAHFLTAGADLTIGKAKPRNNSAHS